MMRCGLLLLLALFVPISAAEPVNKMCLVTPEEPVDPGFIMEYKGVTYGFCCHGCMRRFKRFPQQYLIARENEAEARRVAGETPKPIESETTSAVVATPNRAEVLPEPDLIEVNTTALNPSTLERIGRFHLVALHLPIGIVFFAAFTMLIHGLSGSASMLSAGRIASHFAAALAPLAAGLGWALWLGMGSRGAEGMLIHQITGTLLIPAALASSFFAGWKSEIKLGPWRIMLIITALLTIAAGHFGGELVHGDDFLFR